MERYGSFKDAVSRSLHPFLGTSTSRETKCLPALTQQVLTNVVQQCVYAYILSCSFTGRCYTRRLCSGTEIPAASLNECCITRGGGSYGNLISNVCFNWSAVNSILIDIIIIFFWNSQFGDGNPTYYPAGNYITLILIFYTLTYCFLTFADQQP